MIRVIRPEYIGLIDWAAALISDFSEEPIPKLQDENKWQEWAAIVAGTGVFQNANIPPPFTISEGKKTDNFKDWTEWATAVYSLMANEPKQK
jgi:hypothetical protein